MAWFLYPINKYFTLDGRASVKEFWTFTLIHLTISTILFFASLIPIVNASGPNGVSNFNIFLFIMFVVYLVLLSPPAFALQVRRLHDSNRSGWYILVKFIPIIGGLVLLWFLTQEKVDNNNYFLGNDC